MKKQFDRSSVILNWRICGRVSEANQSVQAGLIPLQWNASEQRQKAKTTLFALPFNASEARRGDREVGVVREAKARLLCRFAPRKDVKIQEKRSAFTLAEVLITLGIIGVVAAMTMPNLISNMQSEALAKKKLLFDSRLEEAMNQMRFHEKLTGYSKTNEFVDELAKYLKINEICDSSSLSECFPDVVISSCDDEYTVDELVDGTVFAATSSENDFTSDSVALVFADGTKAMVNYDLNCDWLDPYDGGANRSEASQCVAILADVNGDKGKNTVGDDIYVKNSSLGTYIDGTCWNLNDATIVPINCQNETSEDAIKYCDGSTSFSNDYWAGAMKACDEQGKSLPTMQQLADLANYLFDTDKITASSGASNLTLNTDKLAEFNAGDSFYGDTYSPDYYRYWSDSSDDTYGYYLLFDDDTVSFNAIMGGRHMYQPVARCVK
ncbi:MAG: type II secretion system protein [Candidatus Gastranaerophilales bacterium]